MITSHNLLDAQRWVLHPQHKEGSDFCIYQGGFGSGKTHAGFLFGYMASKIWPGSRGLVCASSYAMVRDTTRVKWEDLLPANEIQEWKYVPDRLKLANGSEVWFMQGDGERIKSTEFNWIHIEEGSQLGFDDYQKIEARLRRPPDLGWPDYRRRLLITTNPHETPGWIDREFGQASRNYKTHRRVIAPTYENIYLLRDVPDYVDIMRGTFDSERQKVYIEGQTGNLGAGAVYYQFTEARNVDSAACYRPELPIHLSFDFNVSFMYAVIFQEQRRHFNEPITTWAVDEIAIKSSATEEVCETFLQRYQGHAAGVRVYGDPSGYQRDTRSTHNDYEIIRQTLGGMHDFALLVNRKDAVSEEFRVRNRTIVINKMLEDGRYLINEDCQYLRRSIAETRWDPNKEGLWKKVKVVDPASDEFVVDHPHDAADYYFAKRWPYRKKDMSFQ